MVLVKWGIRCDPVGFSDGDVEPHRSEAQELSLTAVLISPLLFDDSR